MEEEGEKSEKRIGPDLPNSTNYEFSGGFRFRSGKDLRNYFSNCHRASRAASVFPTDSRVWGLAAQPERMLHNTKAVVLMFFSRRQIEN
jgi:hypothetical protein